MKRISLLLHLLTLVVWAKAQSPQQVADVVTEPEIRSHLQFLAADEMRGREAGTPELDIAANYIRSMFGFYGLPPAPGTTDYFQPVTLINRLPPQSATAQVRDEPFNLAESLLLLGGESVSWQGDFVYVGYGDEADMTSTDVKGKMVLALAGSRDADNLNRVFVASLDKVKRMEDAGAIGLVEMLAVPQAPWPALVNYLSQPRMAIRREDGSIPHVWLKPADLRALNFKDAVTVSGALNITLPPTADIPAKNVAALVMGKDDRLRDEYIVMTAHYDHVGVQRTGNEGDSIFNGARDNALGTVALLQAAKYFSANPPRRSVLLVALTAEEKGLLGSEWYCEHPLVPLNKTVLNINCDGVGYNDKSILTSISWGRTSTDPIVTRAASAFDLRVGGDPDPRENFYERSDQVNFAREGVVAIKLQPGLARMDDEIRKFYHRPADEVSSLDLGYVTKFYRAFVYAAALLADETSRPAWNEGDKFEEASKKLYGSR